MSYVTTKLDNGQMPFWPYCPDCKRPMDFEIDEPFAFCGCGCTEWGHPRPASYVLNPGCIFKNNIAVDQASVVSMPFECYSDGFESIFAWELTWRERLRLLLRGRFWLRVLTGGTNPQPIFPQFERPYRVVV